MSSRGGGLRAVRPWWVGARDTTGVLRVVCLLCVPQLPSDLCALRVVRGSPWTRTSSRSHRCTWSTSWARSPRSPGWRRLTLPCQTSCRPGQPGCVLEGGGGGRRKRRGEEREGRLQGHGVGMCQSVKVVTAVGRLGLDQAERPLLREELLGRCRQHYYLVFTLRGTWTCVLPAMQFPADSGSTCDLCSNAARPLLNKLNS